MGFNSPYCSNMNSIRICYATSISRIISYFTNIFGFKFFVFGMCAQATTTFINHIIHIVSMCSEKQMIWINTRWIIAMMTNKHSMWNITFKYKPCSSMGFPSFSLKQKRSVTFLAVNSALPKPTCFSFFNVSKKSFFVSPFRPTQFKTINSTWWVFSHGV